MHDNPHEYSRGQRVSSDLPLRWQIRNVISAASSKRFNRTFNQITALFNANNNITIVSCEFGERLKKNL
jgi:hypothetical protein